MSHLDPEQLALLAMGESVASASDEAHLAACGECATELRELSYAAAVARSTVDDSAPESPPDRVWQRISDELGLQSPGLAPVANGQTDASAPASPQGSTDDPATPAPAAPRRRSRLLWALAASIAVVLVIGGAIWGTVAVVGPTQIAAAALEAFPDHPDATGTADVEELRDGTLRLRVTLEAGAEPDAFREVWLIRNDAGALVSLGVLDGSEGTFAIPEGLDLAEYSLVDISYEPLDGDPLHSGDSIVRGQLDFA